MTMSRRDDLALGNRSRRALLLTLIGTVAIASPALAQNTPIGQQPSSPFQQKIVPGYGEPPGEGMWTPERQTPFIETRAKHREDKSGSPVERYAMPMVWDPRDLADFSAMARYSLLLLSVVTQKSDELPLKRLYLRLPDREIPLLKISSWPVHVDQGLVTSRMYGPFREDGFYLFPAGIQLRTAQIQADFAASRSGFPVLEFPTEQVPRWLKELQNSDPEPNALPTVKVLQAFIKRKTSGFPIPASLPSPEAKTSTPEPVLQAKEPTKQTSLKDLFKK